MEKLESLLRRFKRKRGPKSVRLWIGAAPEGEALTLPHVIAAQVGYPDEKACFAESWAPKELQRNEAAGLMAFLAVESLAYGNHGPPRDGLRDQALEGLADLDADARFYTNGFWAQGQAKGPAWTPLSSSTFDAGVIGVDKRHAFIFWVEEED